MSEDLNNSGLMSDDMLGLEQMATDVVCAHLSNNQVRVDEVPNFLRSVLQVYREQAVAAPQSEPAAEPARNLTKAQIKASITPDALKCLECGKSYSTLRRHLNKHGLDEDSYREKWGLPKDYPMVAPAYSLRRREMAVSIGLGRPGITQRGRGKVKAVG